MVRYAPSRKEETRQTLVAKARSLFRRKGFEQVSIDTLAKAAGFTRGVFYAHFASKEALVREVLKKDSGLTESLEKQESNREVVLSAMQAYLDPRKRHELIECPLVAHGIDSFRGSEERRALYLHQIEKLCSHFEAAQDENSSGEVRNRALRMTALTLGSAMLSALALSDEFAEEVATSCLTGLDNEL